MPPILNAQGVSKAFGAAPLFRDVSFTVSEGDRIGLIGPNGSGKSTLLQILIGRVPPDSGEIAVRKLSRISYIAQESEFAAGESVRSIIQRALEAVGVPRAEWEGRIAETLGRVGFDDFSVEATALSGGWRKRLVIAEALAQEPDILLLDEPTNHLDLAGIEWLEGLLQSARFACVVVSHDRYFLENAATSVVELNRLYPEGIFRVDGNYSAFLERKEKFLEAQARRQEALENRVRNEIEWLRHGAKARTSKSKARIDKAQDLIRELADMDARGRHASAQIDFSATDRQTKRLIEMRKVSFRIGERTLFENLDFIITAGMRVGLVGPNGSGKTTLLRLLQGDLPPSTGEIRRADSLRIVHFDQNREIDPTLTLARALAPDSDSVVYGERVIHVASWAARFLFNGEQLNQPVSRLSGGERARILIAKLMLEPADVLLLDEPTNDLDIQTLEILEESLLEYRGALVMVTHDRYLLDRVSKVVLGLDGMSAAERFADYSQWDAWQKARKQSMAAESQRRDLPPTARVATSSGKKKLSYLDAREFATIEQRIADAEQTLAVRRAAFEDPEIVSDASGLLAAEAEMTAAQKVVDDLYARWAELEEKGS
ncbi:MAG: ABC-F family ATP-binding cassette domain-containing protein [Candidatus Korobacteraceae bacterium]